MRGFRSCRACHQRWAQESGLCRSCRRDPQYAHVMEAIARRAQQIEEDRLMEIAKLPRRLPRDVPNRLIVIQGVCYEVVWDGT